MSIALLQITSITQNAVTNIALAYPANVIKGDLLIALGGTGSSGTSGVLSVTDTQGNVWTKAAAAGSFDDPTSLSIFWAIASVSGPNTVTLSTNTAANPLDLIIAEYSQANAAFSPYTFDQTSSNNESHQSGPVTTLFPSEVLIAGTIGNAVAIGTWSVTGAFTIQKSVTELSGTSGLAYADMIVSNTGTFQGTWSNTGGLSASSASVLISFAIGSTPGANPPNMIITIFREIFLPAVCCRREMCWPISTQKVWYIDHA